MKLTARISLSLALSLALVLTGQSMAMARGKAPAADQIVICSGNGLVVMTVDAEGNPTAQAHLCPDCALNLLQGLLSQSLTLCSGDSWNKFRAYQATIDFVYSDLLDPQARDPPWVI